jgi:predicted alpha/beta-fold hydrolase
MFPLPCACIIAWNQAIAFSTYGVCTSAMSLFVYVVSWRSCDVDRSDIWRFRFRPEPCFTHLRYSGSGIPRLPATTTMPFLRIGYKRIHYADLKPEASARETFIFMHGLGSSQDYYHALTPALVAKGFRCILFDNTGAGRSSYTFVEQSVQSLADDVIGILDALEVSKAVFVGHSMGG